jgi:hypothetical protein
VVDEVLTKKQPIFSVQTTPILKKSITLSLIFAKSKQMQAKEI